MSEENDESWEDESWEDESWEDESWEDGEDEYDEDESKDANAKDTFGKDANAKDTFGKDTFGKDANAKDTFGKDTQQTQKRKRNDLPKPCLTRLARKGGVKSISDECFEEIRNVLVKKVETILKTVSIITNNKETKVITTNDLYKALEIHNISLTKSTELGIKNVLRK